MSRRVMAIGLDGMPHWLLRQLADDGVMPTVAELLPHGTLRPLRAPVPEISSTSWASFVTGTDPGRHGIYGFIDLAPGGYRTHLPDLRDVKARPIWEYAGRAGARALVLNVPGTYPAPEMDGVLVSGFVAPDFDRAVQPAAARAPLRELGYRLDVEVGDAATDPVRFLDRATAAIITRRRAFRYLLDTEDWRLGVCVFTETDRVQHFLWRHLTGPPSPLRDQILAFYRQVDDAIAELLPPAADGGLVILSDHGFGSADTQFYLNAWLRQAGYLALPPGCGLDEVDEATVAFALDPGRIFLNRRDRFPRGRAVDGDAADALAGLLLRLRRTPDGGVAVDGPGRPLVQAVLRGEQIYSGPHAATAPDLVAMPAPGVQLRGAPGVTDPFLPAPFTGTHTRDDATFWCRGDRGTGPVEMRDVAPTLLAMMGIDSAGMEGRDVRGAYREPAVTTATGRSF